LFDVYIENSVRDVFKPARGNSVLNKHVFKLLVFFVVWNVTGLYNLHSSQNILKVIKYKKKLKLARRRAHMGRWEMHVVVWSKNIKERDRLENVPVYC
jgi:hypothetical protein